MRDYVRWKVRKAVVKVQRQQEQLIKFPKSITKFFQRFKETCDKLYARSNRVPDLDEIATQMDMDMELVRKNLALGTTLMSEGDNLTSEDASFMRYLKDLSMEL